MQAGALLPERCERSFHGHTRHLASSLRLLVEPAVYGCRKLVSGCARAAAARAPSPAMTLCASTQYGKPALHDLLGAGKQRRRQDVVRAALRARIPHDVCGAAPGVQAIMPQLPGAHETARQGRAPLTGPFLPRLRLRSTATRWTSAPAWQAFMPHKVQGGVSMLCTRWTPWLVVSCR